MMPLARSLASFQSTVRVAPSRMRLPLLFSHAMQRSDMSLVEFDVSYVSPPRDREWLMFRPLPGDWIHGGYCALGRVVRVVDAKLFVASASWVFGDQRAVLSAQPAVWSPEISAFHVDVRRGKSHFSAPDARADHFGEEADGTIASFRFASGQWRHLRILERRGCELATVAAREFPRGACVMRLARLNYSTLDASQVAR